MTKRALVLVEGFTEERFVKSVLQEHFWGMNLHLVPTLLVTKRVKDGPSFKGGVTNFRKFENDVRRLLHGAGNALVTTFLDYDGLPSDFPGMNTRPAAGPVDRVTHVEQAIAAHFGGSPALLPYLSLHEFEALLFASPGELPRTLTEDGKQAAFAAIRAAHPTPEHIDETDWPSRRIHALFRGYRKPLHGPITAKRIGLDRLRSECRHFDEWIGKLECYARH
jgi:hypothetical protein